MRETLSPGEVWIASENEDKEVFIVLGKCASNDLVRILIKGKIVVTLSSQRANERLVESAG